MSGITENQSRGKAKTMFRKTARKCRELHAEMLRMEQANIERIEALRNQQIPRCEWTPEQISVIPPPRAEGIPPRTRDGDLSPMRRALSEWAD